MTKSDARKSQAGYSLIELLIVSLCVMLVVALVYAFYRAATVRVGALTESHERGRRAENFGERLRLDLDNAGLNMSAVSTESSGTESLSFPTHNEYDTTAPGRLVKLTPGSQPYLFSTRALGGGTGVFNFTPPANNSTVLLYGSNGQWIGVVIGGGNPSIGVWMGIYANGAQVADTCCDPNGRIPPHLGGDAYSVAVENTNGGGYVVRIYKIRGGNKSLIWTSASPVPAYPIALLAMLTHQNNALENASMTGAPLVDWVHAPMAVAQMPMHVDGRPPYPVFLHTSAAGTPDGFTAIRGDVAVDAVRLTQPFRSSDLLVVQRQVLSTTEPKRGQFAPDDRLLLVDFASRRSALLYLRSNFGKVGDEWQYQVEGVTSWKKNLGWNLFWSENADFINFPAGSYLVKLAAPVEYRWDGSDTVFRREADQAWEIAATGVPSFALSEQKTAANYFLNLSVRMLNDIGYTSADRNASSSSPFETSFAPRSLNSNLQR